MSVIITLVCNVNLHNYYPLLLYKKYKIPWGPWPHGMGFSATWAPCFLHHWLVYYNWSRSRQKLSFIHAIQCPHVAPMLSTPLINILYLKQIKTGAFLYPWGAVPPCGPMISTSLVNTLYSKHIKTSRHLCLNIYLSNCFHLFFIFFFRPS